MPRLTDNYPNAYNDFHGSGTACVFKSGPAWHVRTGPQAQGIVREPRPVHGHAIGATWLSIGRRICDELDSMAVRWTCINPLAYANAGEAKPFCPLILSIGVTPGSLLYDVAVAAAAAAAVKKILAGDGFDTIEVAFVEWVVTRSVGPKLLSFNPLLDGYPYYEGTAALYFRLSKDDKRVAMLTCAHVARPPPAYAANTGMARKKPSQAREEFVALGHRGYDNAVNAMMGTIGDLAASIDHWNDVLRRFGEPVEGEKSAVTKRREEHVRLVAKAMEEIEEVNALHDEVTKVRTTPDQRIIGFVLHSEPIEVSVGPHGYTKDWALIELYDDKIDWPSFKGNKVYVGGKLSVPDFRTMMFPHPTDRATYQYPQDGLLQAYGVVQEHEIRNPQHLDANGDKCLLVVKNGLTTGTTAGYVNGLESFVYRYPEYGINQTSIEIAVVACDRTHGKFSDAGDSGSIVLARDGRIVGILTGGAGPTNETDVTYLTPYWWVEEQIKAKYPGSFLYDVVQ
ncbi:hypothetical protein V8D89_013754 [Ganoderma adspersum]